MAPTGKNSSATSPFPSVMRTGCPRQVLLRYTVSLNKDTCRAISQQHTGNTHHERQIKLLLKATESLELFTELSTAA